MAIQKIGLNFSKLNNLTFPQFNASQSAEDLLREMPDIANQSTNYIFGWGIIIGIFMVVYTTISDKIGGEGFGYDETRAFGITAGITLIFGLILVMIGYVQDFRPIGVMFGLFIAVGLIIAYLENKG